MKHALQLLGLLSACSGLPAPGTPDAMRACENLRMTVDAVRTNYGGDDHESWLARTSFLLQAREYDDALDCPQVHITDEEIYR